MKFFYTLFATLIISLSSTAQFSDLVIVKVDTKGEVPGTTYKFYIQLENDSDHVHIIFGDESNTLELNTTAPFYQNDLAGALSSNINPKIDSLDQTVKYDSFFTIGRTNSRDDKVSNFNLDLTDFEEKGAGFITDNGAWYVTPDQSQAYALNGNKHVLIMQLTTEGVVTGNLNMQGKNYLQEVWRELDYKFSTDNAITEKAYKKLVKSLKKAKK